MSLEVVGLTKKFGEQIAVDNVSFSAPKGQILGFLGPNGAGKSTTMKMITGYYEPTQGTASVCGYDVVSDTLHAQRCIGYLPESNPLYTDMYVKEYLKFVCDIHKLSDKNSRIAKVIDVTGLSKEQNKIVDTLSKGYKQRVGLAQALLHDPEVLILDEPTSGLDMNQLVEIRNLIRELGKEKTVIFSTHIMQEVQALCDRVVIINEGRIVADDPIEELKNRIENRREVIVKFLSNPESMSEYSGINGLHELKDKGSHYSFVSDQNHDIRADIFRMASKQNDIIIELRESEQNVEYIFQKITKG